MRIRFHSRFAHQKILGNSLQKHKNHGIDWEGIQPYSPTHDARHIIWKKSTFPHSLVEKTFEEHSQISLILVHIEDKTDFFDDEKHISRHHWKTQSIQIIAENAKISNISYKILKCKTLDDFFLNAKKYRFFNQMIMIFWEIFPEKYEKNLSKLSLCNEIIWIWNYHFFEKNPNHTLMISGKIFHEKYTKKYVQELQNYENSVKNFLKKHKIAFLSTDTETDIVLTLNNFFKYFYAQ